MNGRAFLDVARSNARGSTEPYWRAAVGRAYYALLWEAHDALDRWGLAVPPHAPIHTAVRHRFIFAHDPDTKKIGFALEQLGELRNRADYHRVAPRWFADSRAAARAVQQADDAVTLLDQIEADPSRRSAAVAGIQAAGS